MKVGEPSETEQAPVRRRGSSFGGSARLSSRRPPRFDAPEAVSGLRGSSVAQDTRPASFIADG
jgi:hypothetical protein